MEIFRDSKIGVSTEVIGNRNVTVDGCDGILEYNDDVISVKAGRLKIKIQGVNLKLTILTDTEAVICGLIKNIDFGF